jgi:hypothetical protein
VLSQDVPKVVELYRAAHLVFQPKTENAEVNDEDVEEVEVSAESSDTKGRINWFFAKNGWCVTYKDADGKRMQSMRGLTVPRTNTLGNFLTASEYQERRMAARHDAMAQWNKLDKSSAPRFVLD